MIYSPATPHSPNPELRIKEPLWRSATAESAVLKTLEALLSIFGALDCPDDTVEYVALMLVLLALNSGCCLALGTVAAMRIRGRATIAVLRIMA